MTGAKIRKLRALARSPEQARGRACGCEGARARAQDSQGYRPCYCAAARGVWAAVRVRRHGWIGSDRKGKVDVELSCRTSRSRSPYRITTELAAGEGAVSITTERAGAPSTMG
jgi:hypothetical protein